MPRKQEYVKVMEKTMLQFMMLGMMKASVSLPLITIQVSFLGDPFPFLSLPAIG
jgi:hypothetical protein